MKPLLFPVALVLALASSPLLAEEHHGDMDMHDCPMHDDAMSADERAAAMDKMFAKLDADANGSISREEFDAHHEEMRREHDENHEH